MSGCNCTDPPANPLCSSPFPYTTALQVCFLPEPKACYTSVTIFFIFLADPPGSTTFAFCRRYCCIFSRSPSRDDSKFFQPVLLSPKRPYWLSRRPRFSVSTLYKQFRTSGRIVSANSFSFAPRFLGSLS